jgi:hypothetical protein
VETPDHKVVADFGLMKRKFRQNLSKEEKAILNQEEREKQLE